MNLRAVAIAGYIYLMEQRRSTTDSDGQAGALEDEITALLASWDNPDDDSADYGYRELARKIVAMCLNHPDRKPV